MIVIKQFFKIALAALLAAVLLNCTPQDRLNRLLKKHPELVKNDTLKVIDTVKIPPAQFDTAWGNYDFLNTVLHDTVTVYKDRVKVKIYTQKDTIKANIYLPGETITKTIKVPVNTVIYKKSGISWGDMLFSFLLGALIMAFLMIRVLIKNK